MKYALFMIFVLTSVVIASEALFASPAATQSWVKNYVLTNTVTSVQTSNIVASVTGASASAIDVFRIGGTNDVNNACDAAVQAAAPKIDFIYNSCVEF